MNRKTALITGLTGQDGSYLAELLHSKEYRIFGFIRKSNEDGFLRLSEDLKQAVTPLYGDLRDFDSIQKAIQTSNPDEIYNLAAQSDVGLSFKSPEETLDIDYRAVGTLVNCVLKLTPGARVYQASSSEMFGQTPPPQSESSLFLPVSPYAQAKLRAHQEYVVGYRKRYGLKISSGILFNHESPRRGRHYVTRKITISLAKIKLGLQEYFELGNMDATRDWGYAGDYVDAMWRMLQQQTADDYVIATGKTHSVREFVTEAAQAIGIEIHFQGSGAEEIGVDEKGRTILKVNPQFYRPVDVDALRGDARKALEVLGWQPTTTFSELVSMMAMSDLDSVQKEVSNLQK